MATKKKQDEREVKGESMRIRVTASEKEAWARAAKKEGRDVSNWLRFIANREAGNLGGDEA